MILGQQLTVVYTEYSNNNRTMSNYLRLQKSEWTQTFDSISSLNQLDEKVVTAPSNRLTASNWYYRSCTWMGHFQDWWSLHDFLGRARPLGRPIPMSYQVRINVAFNFDRLNFKHHRSMLYIRCSYVNKIYILGNMALRCSLGCARYKLFSHFNRVSVVC